MDYMSKILYAKTKGGKLRQWSVSAMNGVVSMLYGEVGGSLTEQSYEAKPTNVGRSNERDAKAQAIFEAQAAFDHKLARKYAPTPAEAEVELAHLPMLAKPFDKNGKLTSDGKRAKFPQYVQPKYDGFRCLARWEGDEIVLTSRQGKPFDLPHIAEALHDTLPREVVFDGELYVHGVPLQRIASLAKKNQRDSVLLQYMVYDCVLPDSEAPYSYRYTVLGEALCGVAGPVVLADTYIVGSLDEARVFQARWLEEGYEGAILRSPSLLYRYAYRSNKLLKLKTFEDAEFQIVDVVEGKGGLGVLRCLVNGLPSGTTPTDDNTFGVTCGSHEERRRQLANPSDYIGKPLTVRYAFLTEERKPFHPVGVAVREEWD